MSPVKPIIMIPVELQGRELEPKLLLACVAANRGFSTLIGPRREMHFHIPSFPNSIYLSKSTTNASRNVFRNLKSLGDKIVVWDEEALVALPPELYYRHRMSPDAIRYVSHLFAWGEENAQLWRQYQNLPAETPIYITGNPRGDLLRPELRSYYNHEADRLRKKYGNFILINTNFSFVNAYYSDMNLLMPDPDSGGKLVLTRRGQSLGLSYQDAESFTAFKRAILEDFLELIFNLDRTFPNYTIVVRPHPAENQEIYRSVAARCDHVRVVNEGNVVPWLLAARVLLHNGCTTGIEAYALDVPAVAYRTKTHKRYDLDFHHLPNQLSHECYNFEELQSILEKIIAGQLGPADGEARRALMNRHLAAQDGPLACERIVDVLEKIVAELKKAPPPSLEDRLKSRVWALRRRIKKRLRQYRPNMSHNRPEFLRHRYPKISLSEMRDLVVRFEQLLGNQKRLSVSRFAGQFYRINSWRNSRHR
jgi:surface carbohydrate biosynthesis protein